MRKIVILSLIIISLNSVCFAKPKNYYIQNQHMIPAYTSINNDQERCQAEANYMAANKITGHVWGCIGRFEGIGVGYSPRCNTCTPSSSLILTGDASAQDNNGKWYRVRSWR